MLGGMTATTTTRTLHAHRYLFRWEACWALPSLGLRGGGMGLSGGVVAAAATPAEATVAEALRGFLKESFLFPRGEEPESSLLFMWSISSTPLGNRQEPCVSVCTSLKSLR